MLNVKKLFDQNFYNILVQCTTENVKNGDVSNDLIHLKTIHVEDFLKTLHRGDWIPHSGSISCDSND